MEYVNCCSLFLSAFRDRGVPKPTSEYAACPSPDGSSAWASAKGGEARWPETGVREVEVPRPSCSSRAQALVLPFIVVRRGSRCTMGGSRVLRV
jgi:hypothetical protein